MAVIYLKEGNYLAPNTAWTCADYDLASALEHNTTGQANLTMNVKPPTLERPYVSLKIYGSRVRFPVDEGYISLVDIDNLPAPFLPDLVLGGLISKPAQGEGYKNVKWTTMNPVVATSENQPEGWVQQYWSNYYKLDGDASSMQQLPNTGSAWVVGETYTNQGVTARKFCCDSGNYEFSFRTATRLRVFAGGISWAQGLYSGLSSTGNSEDWGFTRSDNSEMLPYSLPTVNQFVANSQIEAGSQSRFVQTYPVRTIIPAGTTVKSTGYAPEYTAEKNVVMFGVISIVFNPDGLALDYVLTVMEDKVWKSQKLRNKDFGEDTKPIGGQGVQSIGKSDPKTNISIAKNGGLLTNPFSGSGFVVYRFTEAEFTDFMNKVYSQTALPDSVPTLTAPLSHWLMEPTSLLLNFVSKSNGWSNLENIVFIKNSPINFPCLRKHFRKLSIGVLGVSDLYADVVQEYVVTKPISLTYANNPNCFTDVEPYKSAAIYFPFAGEAKIMPSYLIGEAGVSITGRCGFNLLTSAAIYSCTINGDNGFTRVSKDGYCAKDADIVLTKSGAAEGLKNLVPAAAVGVATIATGGMTTPALATTTAGAATGFIANNYEMNVVNVPPVGSNSPYDECVYAGLRDIYLYSVKAQRFTSGEDGELTGNRGDLMGYFCYYYVDNLLNKIGENYYVSVSNIKMNMSSGMTKSEYDEIIALLMEGVWL